MTFRTTKKTIAKRIMIGARPKAEDKNIVELTNAPEIPGR
jgi:hypothetical protein